MFLIANLREKLKYVKIARKNEEKVQDPGTSCLVSCEKATGGDGSQRIEEKTLIIIIIES